MDELKFETLIWNPVVENVCWWNSYINDFNRINLPSPPLLRPEWSFLPLSLIHIFATGSGESRLILLGWIIFINRRYKDGIYVSTRMLVISPRFRKPFFHQHHYTDESTPMITNHQEKLRITCDFWRLNNWELRR